jgi:PiT family inorganic phosphate transporter
MEHLLLSTVILIAIALIFDFTNGFHDAANSIATVVATGTLKPRQAVAMAAVFNFIVMFFITHHVAATIGKGIVNPAVVDFNVIFGCLLGAIAWNLITWYLGLPTSSSHALIGGLIGATMCKAGADPLIWDNILRTAAFIVLSPVIGFLLGAGINTAARSIWPQPADKQKHQSKFRWAQLVSSACYSMGHGANDAQKTAGIIFLILTASGALATTADIPAWVIGASFVAIGLGTLAGGWRIVNTLGFKLTELDTRGGFCAETGGSVMLFIASAMGIPVSTTHTITGAILGVGASETEPNVKWRTARPIVLAWLLTIPCSALMAAAFYTGFRPF